MKKCVKCGVEKPFEDFNKRKGSKDGYRNDCKKCKNGEKSKENCKKYYRNNRDVLLMKSKERKFKKRNLNGPRIKLAEISEKIELNKKVCTKCLSIKDKSEFREDNSKKDKISSHCNDCKNRYYRNRKLNDILYKLICNLRSSLSQSIKRNKLSKKHKTLDILGCSLDDFKSLIESKFLDGMSWDNYGEWHLDHKIPISWAENENEVYILSHFSNFQPLWKFDNLSKGNRRCD
jgi:hypothetical protein